MSSTVQELIEGMPASFHPEKAGSAKASIKLVMTGDESGEWEINIADGKCTIPEEMSENPDVTVTMAGTDFVALSQGRLNPVQAFMGGKIKIAGNVGLVMQMMQWFDLG
jgi:putative sterol carrier protein